MSNTIDKIKPSGLNPFDGDFRGDEIIQVTRSGVGTYKTTISHLKSAFAPVLLTQAEYDALEAKDPNTTYYIYEE